MAVDAVLVPITETTTARDTVDYAVDLLEEGTIHFVVALAAEAGTPEGDAERDRGAALLDRARAWVHEDDPEGVIDVRTAFVGRDEYLFGPQDYATAFIEYADGQDIGHLIVDPEYWVGTVGPMMGAFESTLEAAELTVEEAATPRPARHERVTGRINAPKVGTLFLISLGFYLVLGDPTYWFDWVTGVAVAGLVAVMLGHVTFASSPTFPGSIWRTVRFAIYIPYLLYEIIKANIAIAIVILRPSMPIDPRMTEVRAQVGSGLPLLALANSITLTPGTLTVRANDQHLLVHTLLASAREDLFDGRLERAVRFVFYGREHAVIATPRERGDTAVVSEEEST